MFALGWVLLHAVWQGVIVGALAGLLLILLRHASPRWRYAVCALALLISLLLPSLHLTWLLIGSAQEWPGEMPDWLLGLQAQQPAFVTAWSLGVGLMTARLGLGLIWVQRLGRSASPAPAVWQARLDALALRLGLRRRVLLKLLPALDSPLTIGCWRPVVLLPMALLSGMPLHLLEALIAHELAHVRRWDYLANVLQSIVEALLFFHPVVWWLSTRMRMEREQVADELAAEALGDPRCVALALHELSRMHAPPISSSSHLVLSAQGGSLFKRVERLLLAPQPHQHPASWKLALPALLLASASLLVQAGSAQISSGTVTLAPAAVAPTPLAAPDMPVSALLHLPLNARHVLVLEEGSGRVVMAKDADAVVPIASLTKLMTAMVLLDAKLDPAEPLRIAPEDVDTLKHSRSHVPVGAQMSRGAALKLALMSSDNRAAAALARTYPGGSHAFIQALQAKIHNLGLTRTAIAEPTGLSPANTSTANEVAKIVAAASRYPEIAQITSGKQASVPVNGRPRELHNTNGLVGGKGWDIRLSKTGYTEEAGRCLTMLVKSGARIFTVVLLDADGSAQRLRDALRIRQSLAKLP